MLTAGLVIILLIAVNALFVAAKFATVSVRPSRIHQLAQEGNSRASRLLAFTNKLRQARPLCGHLSGGITISSLALGAYAQATLSEVFGKPTFAEKTFDAWAGHFGGNVATRLKNH